MNLHRWRQRQDKKREQDKQNAEARLSAALEQGLRDQRARVNADMLRYAGPPAQYPFTSSNSGSVISPEALRRIYEAYGTSNFNNLYWSGGRNSVMDLQGAIDQLNALWRYEWIEVEPGARVVSVMKKVGEEFDDLDLDRMIEEDGKFRLSLREDEKVVSYAVERPDGHIEVRRYG